jgi:hypothetical protein
MTRHKLYEKEKGSSNNDTKQFKNRVIQMMAFQEEITLFAVNNIGIKNFTGKKVLCKNPWSSPLNQA